MSKKKYLDSKSKGLDRFLYIYGGHDGHMTTPVGMSKTERMIFDLAKYLKKELEGDTSGS